MKTYVELEDGSWHREEPASPLPSTEPYRVPEDVPVALRQNIAYAHLTGLTPQQLGLIYDIPDAWVEEFVRSYADPAH